MAGLLSTILIVIVTILFPPLGVFVVAECSADLLINILLTCLGYFPGHIHAFYILYVYQQRREEATRGILAGKPAPGVYSDNVNSGGRRYGTIA